MTTTAQAHVQLNRAVVAFLDGRRQRGFIYDFSAVKESFRLSPESDTLQQRGVEIKVKDLKAVFFVRFCREPGVCRIRRDRKLAAWTQDGHFIHRWRDSAGLH